MVKVTIQAKENGPLIVETDGKRLCALCRCTASENKPSCDSSHAKSGFKAEASETKVCDWAGKTFFLISHLAAPVSISQLVVEPTLGGT